MRLPFRLLLSGLALFAVGVASAQPVATGPATADADYAAWQAVQRQALPRDPKPTKEQIEAFLREKCLRLELAAEQFPAAHPQDPRRWELIWRSLQTARGRVYPDAARQAASEARDERWLQQLLAASDARADLVEQGHGLRVRHSLEAAQARHLVHTPFDAAALQAAMDEFAAKYPGSRLRGPMERTYLELLGDTDPAAAATRQQKLVTEREANAEVADLADALLAKASYPGTAMDLKFTAVDGRAVDLTRLRGKVVLVDFWATWCGPCIAELPNVKKVYAAYHDKGFEVVGVALEKADFNPADTPEQHAGKFALAKQKLTDFTTKDQMPWPQYMDGLHWKTEISARYHINSIPAMFLVDQDGRIISTDAHGGELEAEVKRLLKL